MTSKRSFRLLFILLLFVFLQSFTPFGQSDTPIFNEGDSVRFAVIGDYGADSLNQADVAALVKSMNPDLIITTGDNNYPHGEAATIDRNVGKYFHEYIGNYQGEYGEGSDINRFFPSIGNHDWASPQGVQPYLDYFTLPGNERYYDFVWGPVHFFSVDNDHHEPDGIDDDDPQAEWLQARLAESEMQWKIVYMHHPPYTSGARREPNPARQWPFAEWGATAVLTGHDHLYERLSVDGIPYFVNGIGGADVYGYDDIDVAPESVVRYNASHGAMLVEAHQDSITFQFYGVKGRPLGYYADPIYVGEWVEVELAGAIQGNGIYSFVVDGTYPSSVFFSTRETDTPPQLVLEIEGRSDPVTYLPIHDTYVKDEQPDSNYDNEDHMRLRLIEDEHYRGYVQFGVLGVNAPVERAVLRLYMQEGSGDDGGLAIYNAPNTFRDSDIPWTEEELAWVNAPFAIVEMCPIDTYTIALDEDGTLTTTAPEQVEACPEFASSYTAREIPDN